MRNAHFCEFKQTPQTSGEYPLYPWAASSVLSVELIYEAINYCDVRDLGVAITTINHFYTSVVHRYMRQCFEIMAGRFFKDKEAFANMLTDCWTVVSGRAALHVRTLTDKNACE